MMSLVLRQSAGLGGRLVRDAWMRQVSLFARLSRLQAESRRTRLLHADCCSPRRPGLPPSAKRFSGLVQPRRCCSTNKGDAERPDQIAADSKNKEEAKGVFQRFKDAYKEYGKALIGVHCVTSAAWFGTFFYAASTGLDVIPILEYVGAGEKVIGAFKMPGVGNAAVAYLLYKLATPARYTVTIVGTQLTVRMMRRWGYWEAVAPQDSIRQLVKDGRVEVKDRVKDRVDDLKGDMKEKYSELKEKYDDRVDDYRGKWQDKKEKLKDKYDSVKKIPKNK